MSLITGDEIQVLSQVFHKCLHDRILSLSSSSSFNHEIFSSSMPSFKANFCGARNVLDKFRTSLARVAKIMGIWLRETYIVSGYSRGSRIKSQKESQKDAVYLQPEDNHERIIAKRGKVLRDYTEVQTQVANDFSF